MPRLIDEDKAKEVLTDYYHIHTNIQRIALEEALSRVPTIEAIPVDYMLTKAHSWLIDRSITGSEMKFLRDLIKEWEADEAKYLDFKSSLDN